MHYVKQAIAFVGYARNLPASLEVGAAMKIRLNEKIPQGVVALGFVSMFMDVSSEMVHSILPLFMVSVLGASALSVGFIEGVAESTAYIVKIFSGALSDWTRKRKPLLLLGYGLAAVTRPLFPLAQSIHAILIARFMDRIGKGIRSAPRDALLADITPPEMRGSAYGLRQSMDTIGSFLGPVIAMVLMYLSANNFRFVFWAAVIPAAMVIAIIAFGVREPDLPHLKERRKFPLSFSQLDELSPGFWGVVAVGACLTLARFSEAFLVLRGGSVGLDAALAPAVLIVMNLVYSFSAYPAGILSDRIGKSTPFLFSIGFLVAADILLALAAHPALVFAGAALWGLHMGFSQGVLTAMVADHAPDYLRGTAFGLYNLAAGFSLFLASFIAGVLWKIFGPAATFGTGAAFSLLAFGGFLLVRALARKRNNGFNHAES